MDVRGAMIVEVDRGAQAIKAEHRRQGIAPTRNPSGWLYSILDGAWTCATRATIALQGNMLQNLDLLASEDAAVAVESR
jgi:hypothetical protein